MLEVDKVNSFYNDLQVLRNVSFKVEDGYFVLILGPNGHGKSTLLKVICGLVPVTSGSINLNGTEITKLPTKRIVEMGMVYIAEERHLFPQMTVIENLRLGAYNRNARSKERENLEYCFELFPRLRERRKRFASTLSGGEARMLAIGRGLMSCAKFLCIDEPSLGLAPHLRTDVFKKIKEINRSGVSVLLVEQTSREVSDFADRIYLLENGRIVFEGTKEQALENRQIRKVFLGKK